jgi:hypothetical protein
MDSFAGDSSDPRSLHKYLYAHANPVNGLDPSGHEFNLQSLQVTALTMARLAVQVGARASRGLVKARRFFWDSRTFNAVSKAYWKANGPANGRSLHHWLIPQRWARVPQGLRNAGFNLLEMPKVLSGNLTLNQWMGFAVKWGGYRMVIAHTIENGIRLTIPLSVYHAATIATDNDGETAEPSIEQIELTPFDWENDRGFEDLRDLTGDENDAPLVVGPGPKDPIQP